MGGEGLSGCILLKEMVCLRCITHGTVAKPGCFRCGKWLTRVKVIGWLLKPVSFSHSGGGRKVWGMDREGGSREERKMEDLIT